MIRTERARQRQVARLFQRVKPPGAEIVLTEKQFQRELKKEIYRSDRRHQGRAFGLVRLMFRTVVQPAFFESSIFAEIASRLRITDSIGWYEDSLSIILPETDKEGTLVLANAITRIATDAGLEIDTEVSIYPMDDELISLADELNNNVDQNDHGQDDHERQDNGHPDTKRPHTKFGSNASVESNVNEQRNGGTSSEQAGSSIAFQSKLGSVHESKHRFVPRQRTPWWKRAVDIVGAGTGLLLLSPVLATAAIAIKCSSKGPVFFKQMREGKDGQHFGILKFRTMVIDAEALQVDLLEQSEQDGPAFKLTNDPRITGVGRYLRKSCVDELPQLWNVLCGDMSLVGPRPLPIHESLACTAWQRARLSVLPGLTCTWQAYGGRDVKFAQWMRMDLDYIERRSFWFDLKLIFTTAFIALLHRGSV